MSDYAAAEAAAAVTADLTGDVVDEATAQVEQPIEETPEFEFPNFEADTSGIEDLLDAPDEEPEQEPTFTYQPDAEPENEWDDDDEKRKLKSELAKTQKRLAWEQEQRVKASEKNWREEARRRFPLADVDEIQATSRRGFIKQAQAQHTRYAAKVKPITDALEALKAQAVAEVKQEARAQAEQAWGKPTSGPAAPQVASAEDAAKLDPRNHRSLESLTLAKIKAGLLQI